MNAVDYDAELRLHTPVLCRAWGVQPRDQVLDIGCGTGQTTREAARTARAGSALGVDVAMSAIERARTLARAEGVRNIAFECADAQTHHFAPHRFDIAISRFGTMFFRDPVTAFTNIGRALHPDGRLVMMVWQAHHRNEWEVVVRRSLGYGGPAAGEPDAFSLGDPVNVTKMLQAAGFTDVAFTDVDEPVYYGPNVAAALDWVSGFAGVGNALKRLDATAAARALDRLRGALAAHLRDDGVWLDSRAWIVAARHSERAL